MDIKEKVSKFLEGFSKELWEEIYKSFSHNGKEGIEKLLKEKKQNIINLINNLKEDIKKQLGEVK